MNRSVQQEPAESTADSATALRAETGSARSAGFLAVGYRALRTAQPLHNWQACRCARKAAQQADLFLLWLSAVGSRIFEADDRLARDRGWQITPRRGGLSRNYRDPRFDSLVACTACSGRGRNSRDATCPDCAGTGRIVLNPTAVSQPDRG